MEIKKALIIIDIQNDYFEGGAKNTHEYLGEHLYTHTQVHRFVIHS